MPAPDFSLCRWKPFWHQVEDTATLMQRPYFFIMSEMRTGKSKITIDAAQFLHLENQIDRVLVVAPAGVRGVWYHSELGELAKHLFLPSRVMEYHSRGRKPWFVNGATSTKARLEWAITNYEFLVSDARLKGLLPFCGPKTMLVLDESSFIKTWDSGRTEACLELRKACGRVVLINGTPIFHSPLDLFSQCNMMHESILDCRYITHFKARYAIQEQIRAGGGKMLTDRRGRAVMRVAGWRPEGLEDIQRRLAPYCVRRLQRDCIDMPPELEPVPIVATLDPIGWKAYKQMRDEAVIWLSDNALSTSAQAAVKQLRLRQISAGFVGGVEAPRIGDAEPPEPGLLESLNLPAAPVSAAHAPDAEPTVPPPTFPLGDEKDRAALEVIARALEERPNAKFVVWCSFRQELHRFAAAAEKRFPGMPVGKIYGNQTPAERAYGESLVHPERAPEGPAMTVGTYGTGSFGLNFAAASIVIALSPEWSPGRWAQSSDRVIGPDQKYSVAYFDILAEGPKGQKTVDHHVLAGRRRGEDVATWTSAAWVKALKAED